jgi:peptidoglycan/xylan/chitin deacetylase (PgdA/CDA1 family)
MKLSLPDRCVSLTADDGYLSIYESAYPLLIKYQTPMSVFVSTEAIDKQYSSIMSWEQLREMTELVDVYNHSVTHQHLIDKTDEVLLNEITSAQLRLKSELSQDNKFFAYPYGEFDGKTYHLVEEYGYIGFGQHSGAIGSKSDFLNLPRFAMASSYAEMDSFVMKINTLPMPVKNEEPKFMAISGNNKPALRINFSRPLTSNERYQFACYLSGQEMPDLTWFNSESVIVQAKEPLPQGRSRYNCTMPSKEKGQYYWYSKVWFITKV